MPANDTQIGGDHYKKGGEEHWDRAWRLSYDPFQYIITKWVERWRDKGGVQDLYKAKHAIEKYIEVVEAGLEKQNLEAQATAPAPLEEVMQADKSQSGPLEIQVRERMVVEGDIMPMEMFTYEGGTGDHDHWTCKKCRKAFKSSIGQAPGRVHMCPQGKTALESL